MTTLNELWHKAKSALVGDTQQPEHIAVTDGGEPSESSERLSQRPANKPLLDVLEGPKELLLLAEMPGASAKKLSVVAHENELEIYAEVEQPRAGTYLAGEFQLADWYRRLVLPSAFDGKRAKASLEQGVLEVRIPRRKEAEPKLIPVRAS